MKFKAFLKNNFKYLGNIFSILSIYYVFIIFHENKESIIELLNKPNIVFIIQLGVMLYLITQLNTVITWYIQLKDKNLSLPFLRYYEIIGKSQIGKYLPGNIGHLIGRSVLAFKHSFSLKDISFSLIFESILLIYSGLIIGISFLFSPQMVKQIDPILFFTLFSIITCVLVIYFIYFNKKVNYSLSIINVLTIICLNCLSFMILGLILYLIHSALFDFSISYLQLISAISISFIAGFIMPGSPAGIGIREYVFILLLSQSLMKTDAFMLIIGLRLITIIGDIIMYSLSVYIGKKYLGNG